MRSTFLKLVTFTLLLLSVVINQTSAMGTFPSMADRENYRVVVSATNPHIFLFNATGGGSPVWNTVADIAGGFTGGGGNFTVALGVTYNSSNGVMNFSGTANARLDGAQNLTSTYSPPNNWNGISFAFFANFTPNSTSQYIFDAQSINQTPRLSLKIGPNGTLQMMQITRNFAGNVSSVNWQGAGGDGKMIQTNDNFILRDSQWHHYVVSFEGSNETSEWYRDGVINYSHEIAGNGVGLFGNFTNRPRFGMAFNSTGDLNPNWGTGSGLTGEFNTFASWGRHLSSTEVATIYASSGVVQSITTTCDTLTSSTLDLTVGLFSLLVLIGTFGSVMFLQGKISNGKILATDPKLIVSMFVAIMIGVTLVNVLATLVVQTCG